MSDEERIEWLKSRQAGIGNSDSLDVVVTPNWLDAQTWLRASKDNDEWFRKYEAFGPFCEMQVWWHAKDDHCSEWATMYLGQDTAKSNPTVRQVLAFKAAFETL